MFPLDSCHVAAALVAAALAQPATTLAQPAAVALTAAAVVLALAAIVCPTAAVAVATPDAVRRQARRPLLPAMGGNISAQE